MPLGVCASVCVCVCACVCVHERVCASVCVRKCECARRRVKLMPVKLPFSCAVSPCVGPNPTQCVALFSRCSWTVLFTKHSFTVLWSMLFHCVS